MLRPIVGDDDFALLVTFEAFCDKVLDVGDIFVCGFSFREILIEGVQYV